MKTGYIRKAKLLAKENNKDRPSGSSDTKAWWKKVWSFKLPTKVKIFWWQVSLDIIPTEANLARQHIPILHACRLCGYSEASSTHAIFSCPWVKQVWRDAKIIIPKEMVYKGVTIDFLEAVLRHNGNNKEDL